MEDVKVRHFVQVGELSSERRKSELSILKMGSAHCNMALSFEAKKNNIVRLLGKRASSCVVLVLDGVVVCRVSILSLCLCELLVEHKLHFITTCKPNSHQALYQEVELLGSMEDAISTMTERRWNGRYHERWDYR